MNYKSLPECFCCFQVTESIFFFFSFTNKFLSFIFHKDISHSEDNKVSAGAIKHTPSGKRNWKKNVFYHTPGPKYTVILVNKRLAGKEVIFKVNGVCCTLLGEWINNSTITRGQGVSGATVLCIGGEKDDKQLQIKLITNIGFGQYASHIKKTSWPVHTWCKTGEAEEFVMPKLTWATCTSWSLDPPQILVLVNNLRISHALPVGDTGVCLGRTPDHVVSQALVWHFRQKPSGAGGSTSGAGATSAELPQKQNREQQQTWLPAKPQDWLCTTARTLWAH